MLRRSITSVVIGLTLGFSQPVLAQTPPKVYRIGELFQGRAATPAQRAPLLEALGRLGYVEGRNLIFEYQETLTREQLSVAAAELVKRNVDIIVTNGTPATRAAKQATSTIPIFFVLAADPVQSGLVASFARPGGNLTGMTRGSYEGKMLDLLKQAAPSIRRLACACSGGFQDNGWAELRDAARKLGVEVLDITLQGPDDIERFFVAARGAGADALLVPDVAWYWDSIPKLAERAIQSRLPAIGPARYFVQAGGLLYYGPKADLQEYVNTVASHVDKMLKGSKPADIPVQLPTRFDMLINLKTAKTLGMTIPRPVLLQATEVIE